MYVDAIKDHPYFTLGSMIPYIKSATKFAITTSSAITKKKACNIGTSTRVIAFQTSSPIHPYDNTVSVIIDPDIRNPNVRAILVIIGSEAFFKTCLKRTVRSASPFALAVAT